MDEWGPASTFPWDDAGGIQFAEPLGEHPSGHARNLGHQLSEAPRAVEQTHQTLGRPAPVDELQGVGFRLSGHWTSTVAQVTRKVTFLFLPGLGRG